MGKGSNDDLNSVVVAARQHKLVASDVALLRDKIAQILVLELEDRVPRTAQRNLAIAETQLRDIQARAVEGRIDEAAFAKLADHLKRQVLTRLDQPSPGCGRR